MWPCTSGWQEQPSPSAIKNHSDFHRAEPRNLTALLLLLVMAKRSLLLLCLLQTAYSHAQAWPAKMPRKGGRYVQGQAFKNTKHLKAKASGLSASHFQTPARQQ